MPCKHSNVQGDAIGLNALYFPQDNTHQPISRADHLVHILPIKHRQAVPGVYYELNQPTRGMHHMGADIGHADACQRC
jgi:hypothetical protein